MYASWSLIKPQQRHERGKSFFRRKHLFCVNHKFFVTKKKNTSPMWSLRRGCSRTETEVNLRSYSPWQRKKNKRWALGEGAFLWIWVSTTVGVGWRVRAAFFSHSWERSIHWFFFPFLFFVLAREIYEEKILGGGGGTAAHAHFRILFWTPLHQNYIFKQYLRRSTTAFVTLRWPFECSRAHIRLWCDV